MRFLFKYPTMGRPEWFKDTLQTYIRMLSGQHEYTFLISMNEDDETMNNEEMRKFLQSAPNDCSLRFYFANHENKIEAINADMEYFDFDILFLISDDMIPQIQDFDIIIAEKMKEYFPDLDGALHFNDDCCGKDKCITLSIMGKKLYDYFGYIYHPDYKSFFCDNEFTDEVRRLEKVHYDPMIIVKHDWKGWGIDRDKTYKRNTFLGKGDEKTYEKRKLAGFPK